MKPLKSVSIALLFFLITMGMASPFTAYAAPAVVNPIKIRPYTGIGVLLLDPLNDVVTDLVEPLPLYEEPAIFRLGLLERSKLPPFEWIFDVRDNSFPMIVTSRKNVWLRVVYDDSGREAWLKHPPKAKYQSWDNFLKGQSVSLLAGLQKRYYQASDQSGKITSTTLSSKKAFKVISVDRDWAMVMSDKDSLIWLRWRDEDGRFLIGFERSYISNR